MDNYYYVNITLGICGLIILLLTTYCMVFENRKKTIKNKIMVAIVGATFIGYICDMPVQIGNVSNGGSILQGAMIFVAFIISHALIVLLLFYQMAFLREKQSGSWKSPWTCTIIAIAVFLFFLLSYVFGDKTVYSDGMLVPQFGLSLLMTVDALLLFYYLLNCFRYRKIIGNHDTMALIFYFLIPAIAIIIDSIYVGVNAISFAFAVSALFNFMMVQHHSLNEIAIILEKQNTQLQENLEYMEEATSARDTQFEEIRKLNSEITDRMSIIQSMSRVYFASFYIDIETDTFIEVNSVDNVRAIIGKKGKAQESLYAFCDLLVISENREALKTFVTLSTINERMKDKNVVTCDYQGKLAGWCQLYLIAGERDESGMLKTMLVASRTIHEEKAREEEHRLELEKAMEAAEASNQAKTTFLNNMSHDIRTPMNAILGFTHLMKQNVDNTELVKNYLNKIEDSGEYLLAVINNVLDMARIESGKLELDEVIMNLAEEQSYVMSMFEMDVKKKKLNISAVNNIEHFHIITDKDKLNQIFINLLSNAIKYTPENGEIAITVNEYECDKPGYSRFVASVSDNGIGMSEEFQQHIFESFSRERNTTESKIIGTGLGMSIVKKLVELMGGTISVSSELGKGTTFTIEIDSRVVSEEEFTQSRKFEEDSEVIDFSTKRILLAEDNELNAEIAISILENVGFKVEHALDGVICVDMLNKAEPGYYDLILMDIQMPNLNGYDAARSIRNLKDSEKAAIPIIAMTANAFEEDRRMALESGMNDHLAKPMNINVMMSTIAKVLK